MRLKEKQLRKVKPLKHVDFRRAAKEVSALEAGLSNVDRPQAYSPHIVNVDGTRYVSCDAKYLNKHTNQSGRGDYRWLFQDGKYAGVAVHSHQGYKKVA